MSIKVLSRGWGIAATLAFASCGDSSDQQSRRETSEQDPPVPVEANDQELSSGSALRPLHPCVHEVSPTQRYALFGYVNGSTAKVKVPVGSANRFDRGAAERGQPETFLPGTHSSVFYVELEDDAVEWALNGSSVRASRESAKCGSTHSVRWDLPTAIVRGPRDGEVTFDASNKKSMFPVPKAVRHFSSKRDVLQFARKELNAITVTDDATGEVGVQGAAQALGKGFYIHAGRLVEVQDPIAAFLGGPWGYFMVGDEKICMDGEKCETVTPPGGGDPCSPNGQFCTNDYSFRTNLWFYRSIGSETEQLSGGYDVEHYLCFRWIFPWICSRSTGWNELQLTSTFFGTSLPPPEIPRFVMARETAADNVEEVTVKLWSLFVSIKSTGLPGQPGPTFEATLTGVCGYHLSNGPQGSTQSLTQAGSANCQF